MAFVYDGKDWNGEGIKITRNARAITVESVIAPDKDTSVLDNSYDEREIPLAEFCKALGLQPIPEEVRNGS